MPKKLRWWERTWVMRLFGRIIEIDTGRFAIGNWMTITVRRTS